MLIYTCKMILPIIEVVQNRYNLIDSLGMVLKMQEKF